MNLFIDANIYLNFYHYSSDDLEELNKLIVAIKNGELVVYLPQQVIYEFRRNRAVKIADALKKLNEQKMPNQFPQFCKDYPEYQDLVKNLKGYEDSKNKLLERFLEDVREKKLKADKIIDEIFDLAVVIPNSKNIVQQGKNRFDLGNPPGKDDSYGDAVNWEALLEKVPHGEDLHLIARDKDYTSPIDRTKISEFLYEEWQEVKMSSVTLYTALSDFFNHHFPDIKLASEMQRKLDISRLVNSGSFSSTHNAIDKLTKYSEFTEAEIIEVVNAALSNNQIKGILSDKDVKRFYFNLISGKDELLGTEVVKQMHETWLYLEDDEGIY